jgi:hypothetical protein
VRGGLPLDGDGPSQAWGPSDLRHVPRQVRTHRDRVDDALQVTVLPHPILPGFKGKACYSTALTVTTALDVAYRQALGCLLAQYRASFESRTATLGLLVSVLDRQPTKGSTRST